MSVNGKAKGDNGKMVVRGEAEMIRETEEN